MQDQKFKRDFLMLLREELIPAMGCTEPIALAYAAAQAKAVLGATPEKIVAKCSGNIIKNVRCVSIPNSQGMVGIEAAVALGAFGGDAMRGMEVLEGVDVRARQAALSFAQAGKCKVEYLDSENPLHFIIEESVGEDSVLIEVRDAHTNVVSLKKNGVEIGCAQSGGALTAKPADRSGLNLDNIRAFADEVDLAKIKPILARQIEYNMAIAQEGMSGSYGLGIGPMIRSAYAPGVITQMKAYAAAASEARMGGCDMPVIINSGSGNQGIASSVPVIVFARENNYPEETLYRALAFSSLLTIYQKEFIGKLSAFCGAVSASCAAGAAVTYMAGGTQRQIKDTIANTLANIPGIICDGAKVSCAAKIASSLDAAMLAHLLAMQGKAYEAHTGILREEAGETIGCVGHIGRVGMRQTDKEIIALMLGDVQRA